MNDSALNERRHGLDLHIRDKDLLTGRDCRRLIAEAIRQHVEQDEMARALAAKVEAENRAAAAAAFNALPWWKRARHALAFRVTLSERRANSAADCPSTAGPETPQPEGRE